MWGTRFGTESSTKLVCGWNLHTRREGSCAGCVPTPGHCMAGDLWFQLLKHCLESTDVWYWCAHRTRRTQRPLFTWCNSWMHSQQCRTHHTATKQGNLLLHTYIAQDLVFKDCFSPVHFSKLKSVSLVISIFCFPFFNQKKTLNLFANWSLALIQQIHWHILKVTECCIHLVPLDMKKCSSKSHSLYFIITHFLNCSISFSYYPLALGETEKTRLPEEQNKIISKLFTGTVRKKGKLAVWWILLENFCIIRAFEDGKWYKIANLKASNTLSSSNWTKPSNVVKLHSTKTHGVMGNGVWLCHFTLLISRLKY